MAMFMVMHTYKKPVEEVARVLEKIQVPMAKAMASGQTPARCLKTWNPGAYGRLEPAFCLWEGESADDVVETLRQYGMMDVTTADTMQVDETDWAQVAQEAG
jgi:hypothetical protein